MLLNKYLNDSNNNKRILKEFSKIIKQKINNTKLIDYINDRINTININFINSDETTIKFGNKEEKMCIQFLPTLVDTNKIIINYTNNGFEENVSIKFEENIVKIKEEKIYTRRSNIEKNIIDKIYNNNLLYYKKLTNELISDSTKKVDSIEAYILENNILAQEIKSVSGKENDIKYYHSNENLIATFTEDKMVSTNSLLEEYLFMYISKYECSKEKYESIYNELNNNELVLRKIK